LTFALLVAAMFAVGGDSLATARELYASAAYEDALAVLNTLAADRPAEDIRAADQYRALCLLALGRVAEADSVIAAVISGDPTYRPASDASPRVRAAFTDVRRKVMPAIVQQWYMHAKAQFDRKEFAAAASHFSQILQMMSDPDVQSLAAQPPLSDLRTLASGFRDLSESSLAPPSLPSAPVPVAAAAMPPAVVAAMSSAPMTPRIYSSADTDVVPPRVIRQELPAFPGKTLIGKSGVINAVVDESGAIESAMIQQTVTPAYDKLALAATKTWHYQPATVNGVPVKYRKSIRVTVTARPRD
jgi:TonB family protein